MRDTWPWVPLHEVADVTIGRQRSPKNATGASMVPYLRAANVKDGYLALDDILEMNFDRSEQDTYRLIRGDVLVSEGCGSIQELGASARWDSSIDGTVCFQNTLLRLRSLPGKALPGYIEQWARWAHKSGIWASVASGTNIFHIGAQRAREVQILRPPIAQQSRLIDLMDAIEAAARVSGQVAEQAMLSAKAFLANHAGSVEWQRLGEITELTYGKALKERDRNGGAVPVFGAAGEIGRHDTAATPANVVVVGRKGVHARASLPLQLRLDSELPRHIYRGPGGAGTVRFSEDPCWVIDTAFVASPRQQTDPATLYWTLVAADLPSVATKTTLPGLSRDSAYRLRVPSLANESWPAVLASIEGLEQVARTAIEHAAILDQLRLGILAEFFAGQHRIPDSYDELLEFAS